jgi:2-octaprenyl-6-methoxyphenol hydroxylase
MDNARPEVITGTMEQETEVIVVGGGLNGPLLALALASGGVRSVVLDAGPRARVEDPGFDGRAYALAVGARRLLGALGLWDGLEPQAQPILEIKISDGRAGEGAAPLWLHFDHAEIEEGPMGHFLEDRFLRRALLAAAEASERIALQWEAPVVAQAARPGGIEVTLADGRRIAGRVLVGCDGRESGTAVRAGIGRIGWGYGQTALVAAVAHDRPHRGIAHQFFMPEGPLAILPLPGNRSSIVWTETEARAAAIAALDDAAFLGVLRPRFGDFLGPIALEGRRYSYPLSLSLAESLTGERLALAGDAAHGIHPLAGQGLNLGLRDVAALAEVLVAARRQGRDIGAPDVLAEYARWRRFDSALLAVATDGFNRLFSNDNPLVRLGRDLGLGIVAGVPALRRAFVREAAGLTGDLPRLLRGHRL